MFKSCLLLSFLLCAAGCSSRGAVDRPVRPVDLQPSIAEEELLDKAMIAYEEELYSVAIESWQELIEKYPGSYFIALAELKLADSYRASGDCQRAIGAYQQFNALHRGHEAVPYSRFQIANCHLKRYKGVERDQSPVRRAMEEYQQFVVDYPNNEYARLAKRGIAKCQRLEKDYNALVAKFYDKRGNTQAGNSRKQVVGK